jgi:hypothetical protein
VPKTVPQPVRRLPQVSVADDIISIEDATRLVAAQFHRDAFWNAGADHVPNGRSPEVVRDAAGTSGGDPGAAPRVEKPLAAIPCPDQNPTSPAFVGRS